MEKMNKGIEGLSAEGRTAKEQEFPETTPLEEVKPSDLREFPVPPAKRGEEENLPTEETENVADSWIKEINEWVEEKGEVPFSLIDPYVRKGEDVSDSGVARNLQEEIARRRGEEDKDNPPAA